MLSICKNIAFMKLCKIHAKQIIIRDNKKNNKLYNYIENGIVYNDKKYTQLNRLLQNLFVNYIKLCE